MAKSMAIKELVDKFRIKKQDNNIVKSRAWIEVNLDNITHNYLELEECLMGSGTQITAVLKGNACGHGAVKLAKHLNSVNCFSFAVATVDEAVELREADVVGDILIFGRTELNRLDEIFLYDLTQTIIDLDYAKKLNSESYQIKAQLNIDSGMHRLGAEVYDMDSINAIFSMKNINIRGIYTQLSQADDLNDRAVEDTHKQANKFMDVIVELRKKGINVPAHIQSSHGVLNYPEFNMEYSRVGSAIYGIIDTENTVLKCNLKPVLSLKAKVICIKDIEENQYVGYNKRHKTTKPCKSATISIGYADGIMRNYTDGQFRVLINGQYANVIGQICMDQMMIDVTDHKGLEVDDIVTIIGQDGKNVIKAEECAESFNTIAPEVLSGLGRRLGIIYKHH